MFKGHLDAKKIPLHLVSYYYILISADLLIWFSNPNDIHSIIIKIGEVLPRYLCNNFFMEDETDYASCLFAVQFLTPSSWAMAEAL